MNPILKKLESIDSKVSDLNNRNYDNQRLLNKFRQLEANFRLLFHASRSEIATLKAQMHSDPSNSTNTDGCISPATVDPLKPMEDSEIISLLHWSSDIKFVTSEFSLPIFKRKNTASRNRSSSLSSSSDSSSSISSSSSNSSCSDKFPRRQISKRNSLSTQNLMQNELNRQSYVHPGGNPIDSASHKNYIKVEMKDASTEAENGIEGQLTRLFSASVRNARDHYGYSVMNAPPSRGHILDANEKAEANQYYNRMEAEKCKTCPPYPQVNKESVMDVEAITDDSSQIDLKASVSDIGSNYADTNKEAISEGEIYEELDEDPLPSNTKGNLHHDKPKRSHDYARDDHSSRKSHHNCSKERYRRKSPARRLHRKLSSSYSDERRRSNRRSSTEYSQDRPMKRSRYSEFRNSSPKKRSPPSWSKCRSSSTRGTSSRGGRSHFKSPRNYSKHRTPTSSSSDRRYYRDKSYRSHRQ